MNEKLRTTISIILITAMLIPAVGAAYVLKNDGTITLDHGNFYIDGVTVDSYIISLVGVGGGNFDQNLNTTDDVTHENVTVTDTLTVGGVPITAWDDIVVTTGPSLNKTGYDWYVWKTGVTYNFLGSNGSLITDTDFDDIFNSLMLGSDYKLHVYLDEADYIYDNTLLLLGPTPTVSFGRTPIIQGAGRGRTVLQPADGVDAITLKRGVSAQIYDLTIDMSTSGAVAYGIYGDPTGGSVAYTECGAYKSQVKRVAFKGGVSGGAAMYLINTEWCQFGDLHSYMSNGCDGFLFFTNSGSDYSYCENTFTDFISVFITGDNTIGMGFFGYDHSHACNLMQGTGYIYIRSASGSNTTGVWFRYADYFSMGTFHIEECSTLVDISYCYSGVLDGGKTYCIADSAGDTLFKLGLGNYCLSFEHWHLFAGGLNSVEWVSDPRDDANQYNSFHDITLHLSGGVFTQSITGTTSLSLIREMGAGTFP